MTPERIKEIRSILGITQDDLAVILGVTKTTVGRYEIGLAKPVGEAEKKLAHLDSALNNKEDKQLVFDLIKSDTKLAGLAALGAVLSLGTALFPLALIGATGFGMISAIGSPAGKVLFKTMKNIFENGEKNG